MGSYISKASGGTGGTAQSVPIDKWGREQKELTTAMKNALESGALEFTVNGTMWRRKTRRAKSFTAD